MYAGIQHLMQWRSDLLISGRVSDLAGQFTYPLILFRNRKRQVVNRPDVMADAYGRLHLSLQVRGVVRIRAHVTAMDIVRNGSFRVWVRSHMLDARGAEIESHDKLHYCRETPRGIRTEMVEFRSCPVPELWMDGQPETSALRA